MSRYYRSFLEESVVTPSYPSSLKLFIDAGNPLSYSGSGTTVTDLIGTQNGTLINGVGYSTSNGGYFTFDGVNDFIDFGINTAIRPLTARTTSMWVYVDSSSSVGWFFSDTDNNQSKGSDIFYDNGGYRSTISSNSTYQLFNNNTTSNKGVWYYITTSWNGSTVKGYYNGILFQSTTQTTTPTANTTHSSVIGKGNYPGLFLNGKIAQCKIYDVQRTDAEVLTDFNEFKARYGY